MNKNSHQLKVRRSIQDYEDILDVKWSEEKSRRSTRPTMPLKDRAKIFLPFAALKGYEDALEEIRRKAEEESVQKTSILQ